MKIPNKDNKKTENVDSDWNKKQNGKVESRRFAVVETKIIEGITYQRARVSCGKKRCSKCPHGPYWYARVWIRQKRVRVYIGKEFMTFEEYNLNKKIEQLEKEKKELERR
jgi:hypothetical protein